MQCRLCKSTELLEISGTEETYYYCPECSLIFIDEEEVPGPGEELARYQEHDNTHENEGYVRMFERFISCVLEPHLDLSEKEISRVLDFGCGPGPVLADLLAARGLNVDLYDPYFFPEQDYRGQEYDLITSTEVFEHLQDPGDILETLINHLSEGGYLALMTSFHPGPDDFADWWYKWDPTHISFYTSETFFWIADNFPLNIIFEDGDKYCLLQKEID